MESSAINDIQRAIAQFSGYDGEDKRRLADEQIRAFLGERLAELPDSAISGLTAEEMAQYQSLLRRCEFANQLSVARFIPNATPQSIAAVSEADSQLVAQARDLDGSQPVGPVLQRLQALFDTRDRAMLGQ